MHGQIPPDGVHVVEVSGGHAVHDDRSQRSRPGYGELLTLSPQPDGASGHHVPYDTGLSPTRRAVAARHDTSKEGHDAWY